MSVSAFSNADALLGRYERYREEKEAKAEPGGGSAAETAEASAASAQDFEGASVAWEPNGRCEPHTVWVYHAGQQPESGYQIRVDRYGAAKVLTLEEEGR